MAHASKLIVSEMILNLDIPSQLSKYFKYFYRPVNQKQYCRYGMLAIVEFY